MERVIGKWTFVRRNFLIKLILSLVCLVLCTQHVGFYQGCPIENHLVYSFLHVNLFHLLINLMVLWSIKNKIDVTLSFVAAVAASFLPMFVTEPTMGLSGFLFSAFGIMWGKTGRWKEAVKKAMPFILFTMAVPNVNGLLHFWCFFLGYCCSFLWIKIIYIWKRKYGNQ